MARQGPRGTPHEARGSGRLWPPVALRVNHLLSMGYRRACALESPGKGNASKRAGADDIRPLACGMDDDLLNHALVRGPICGFAKDGPDSGRGPRAIVPHHRENHAANVDGDNFIRGAGNHGGPFRGIPVSGISAYPVCNDVYERGRIHGVGKLRFVDLVWCGAFISRAPGNYNYIRSWYDLCRHARLEWQLIAFHCRSRFCGFACGNLYSKIAQESVRTLSNHSSSEISPGQILAALAPFGISLSDDQVSKIQEYVRLMLKWNKFTSLTSIVAPAEIINRHFGESMFAASLLPIETGRLVDVGSGAGFPGLALKILCPGVHVSLVESNKKKSAFLAEVIRTLGLSQVDVVPMRFEELRPGEDFADFITARAVGGFSDLLRWSRTALSRRGHLLLWVGGEDITSITNSKGWIWNPPARIPESQRRFILVGRYIGEGR